MYLYLPIYDRNVSYTYTTIASSVMYVIVM